MAQMTEQEFRELGTPSLVYIRPGLARDIVAKDEAVHMPVSPNTMVWAVYGADGDKLAVMTDRDSAVGAAIAHELKPVSVH